MTNWQNMVRESIASLATGEGADYGYAYVERLNTSTYKIQTSRPLEEIECDFDAAVKRVIEIASKETSNESLTFALSLPSLQPKISNTKQLKLPKARSHKIF